MPQRDPLLKIEHIAREVHDRAGKRVEPVIKRYPLLFAFLLVFSAAAILHGFDLWADQIALFRDHPWVLLLVGVIALMLTGTLYASLEKMG